MNDITRKLVSEVTNTLAENYSSQELSGISMNVDLPDGQAVCDILEDLRRISFPGYFGAEAYQSGEAYAGAILPGLYEKLEGQIKIALKGTGEGSEDKAAHLAAAFLKEIPKVQKLLVKDVEAQIAGDPAANSREEVILAYPGLYTIFVYRYAHVLYDLGVPLLPRMMSEHAHGKTGIDINPGAVIGEYFFIDHGTGIVIGETTTIGDRVRIYQGVTLGALSTRKGQALSGVKRHPTIEDDVIIYANATILGGNTVVGRNATVAGNTFVTESIPADAKVSAMTPELQVRMCSGCSAKKCEE